VLRESDNIYEVAISSAATSGNFDEALSLVGADALKNIDVFFVIDGTKSMQGIIDTIKGRTRLSWRRGPNSRPDEGQDQGRRNAALRLPDVS